MPNEVPYGFIYDNRDKLIKPGTPPPAETKLNAYSPQQVQSELENFRIAHKKSDTDFAPSSIHHTIGTGANQAASGDVVARLDNITGAHQSWKSDGTQVSLVLAGSYVLLTGWSPKTDSVPDSYIFADGVITVKEAGNYRVKVSGYLEKSVPGNEIIGTLILYQGGAFTGGDFSAVAPINFDAAVNIVWMYISVEANLKMTAGDTIRPGFDTTQLPSGTLKFGSASAGYSKELAIERTY